MRILPGALREEDAMAREAFPATVGDAALASGGVSVSDRRADQVRGRQVAQRPVAGRWLYTPYGEGSIPSAATTGCSSGVERLVRDQEDAGAIPVTPTKDAPDSSPGGDGSFTSCSWSVRFRRPVRCLS